MRARSRKSRPLSLPLACALLFLAPVVARAQLAPLIYDQGALGLAFALRTLSETGRFLQITAHPDDEDSPLFMVLGRGRGMNTALMTLTRGGGGQNEIGPELFEALSILRTEELMSMHRYDQASQYFSRASDFGYSFSREETFGKWGREEILKDVVRVIRAFRPDVITTLPRTGTGGGQHHQATAHIAVEAFRAAGDPKRFPELLAEGLRPWQARKIYERYRWGGSEEDPGDPRPVVGMDTGRFDTLLGRTFYEVGMEARSLHRCQGMGQILPLPGPALSQWKLVDAVDAVTSSESDLFDGLDTRLRALEAFASGSTAHAPFLHQDLVALEDLIEQARQAYVVQAPHLTVPPLAAGLKAVRGLIQKVEASSLEETSKEEILFRLQHKEKDFHKALRLAQQVSMEALVEDGTVVGGQEFELVATLSNGSPGIVSLSHVGVETPAGWWVTELGDSPDSIPAGGVVQQRFRVTVSDTAPVTQPYWRLPPGMDRYQDVEPGHSGLPWSTPTVRLTATYQSHGVESRLERAAQYRYPGPWVGGEQRHTLMVVPPVSVTVDPEIRIIPVNQASQGHEVRVVVWNNQPEASIGSIELELPVGWKAVPSRAELTFTHQDQSRTAKFELQATGPVEEDEFQLSAVARFGGRSYRKGHQMIDYHHIERRVLYHPATITVKTVEVAVKPGLRIGYIMGVGDKVPQAMQQLGLSFNLLNADDLAFGDLREFDVILTGVRAYLNREDLKANHQRVLDWIQEGGTLIVQYNKFEFNNVGPGAEGRQAMAASSFAPYPAQVGRGRVTDENSSIQLLEPGHPVFNFPNRITIRDWQNWVQERGLYFLGEKDPRYRDLVATADPFENNPGVQLGSLVETSYGKGRWIYLGLGLWRELPAGVPGAYRLLANLLSLAE